MTDIQTVPKIFRKGRRFQAVRRPREECDIQTVRLFQLEFRAKHGLLVDKREVRELEQLESIAEKCNRRDAYLQWFIIKRGTGHAV